MNTHKGLYKVNRLPFGVASVPSFQWIMENVFQGLAGVSVYLDDILMTGKTTEHHLANLEQCCHIWKLLVTDLSETSAPPYCHPWSIWAIKYQLKAYADSGQDQSHPRSAKTARLVTVTFVHQTGELLQ